MRQVIRATKQGGEVTVLTDDGKYAAFIDSAFSKEGGNKIEKSEKYNEKSTEFGYASFFDQLWRERGRSDRHFLSYTKN